MSTKRRLQGAEYEGDAPDLAEELARIVGSGRVQASYGADERLRESHGAARLISIGVINSHLENRESAEAQTAFAAIADAAAQWLQRRQLLVPGTLISIALWREVDVRIASWSRGIGGRRYWIDADGRPTTKPPADEI